MLEKESVKFYLSTVQENKQYKWTGEGLFVFIDYPKTEQLQAKGIEFFVNFYDNELDYNRALDGNRKEAVRIMSCPLFAKETKAGKPYYGWVLRDDANKKAWFISLFDNDFKKPGSEADKVLSLQAAEYREREVKEDTHPDWEWVL